MKAFAFGTALTIACSLSISGIAVAKGSGGHSSGGHAGGQASAGQAGGRTHGSSAPHAGTGGRGTGTTPGTSARQPARSRDRQPVVGTAIPRPSAPATFLPGPLFYTPYRMWPYGGAVGLGGLGLRGVFEPF